MDEATASREKGDHRLRSDWNQRSQRDGLQTVMSVRWGEEASQSETKKLISDIRGFLTGMQFDSVTEIGCGIGRILGGFPDKQRVGLDISHGMLDKAKNNLKDPKTRLVCKDGSFLTDEECKEYQSDLVYTVTVAAHVTDEVNFLHLIENMKKMSKKYVMLIEEAHSHKRRPSTYTRTDMIRSISDYISAMEPWHLIQMKRMMCFEDGYAAMVFAKDKSWRF